MSILGRILGVADPLKTTHSVVQKISQLEKDFERFSHSELQEKTKSWQREIVKLDELKMEEYLNEILPEAFAAVRESAKRTLGQRHYDVQLMVGIILHGGKVAKIKPGEEKPTPAISCT